MAGTNIKITVNDAAVKAAFAKLLADGGAIGNAVLKNIGEAMVASTQARFERGVDPQGRAWSPLNPDYAAGKKGPGILRESGQLQASIVYQLGANEVEWGTNKIYGAVHQLGAVIVPVNASALRFRIGDKVYYADHVVIPARPYLGISDDDRQTIVEIVEDHISEVWK